MRRLVATLCCACALLGLSCRPERRVLSLATGGTAGTYHPLGLAMAELWRQEVEGLDLRVESTGASIVNINLLRGGQADLVFVQNDIAYYAAMGMEMFIGQAMPGLRGLATLYPEACQVLSLRSTGIGSIEDVRGKRVAVGAAGSGVEANARQILEAAGLTYADIQVQYLSFAEAAASLSAGRVDAAFITAGFPTAAIQQLAEEADLVLIPLSESIVSALLRRYPFYTPVSIPAGTYRQVTEAVDTVAVRAMLATDDRLDADLVYELTRALFARNDQLIQAHRLGVSILSANALDGMPVELHPGAAAYLIGQP